MHAREMEWSPLRTFHTNSQGVRMQSGWQGEWGCNICGRTILHTEVQAYASVDATTVSGPVCPSDGARTLVVDLAFGSSTWVCLPGCTLSAVDACADVSSAAASAMGPSDTSPVAANAPALPPACERPRSNTFFSAAPPLQNHDATNSFVYCPILLHAAGLLSPEEVGHLPSLGSTVCACTFHNNCMMPDILPRHMLNFGSFPETATMMRRVQSPNCNG